MAEALSKKKVLLGVTGSIAAYKSAEIARLLVSRGYEIKAWITLLSPDDPICMAQF